MPFLSKFQIEQAIKNDAGAITAYVDVDLGTLMSGIEAVNDHVSTYLVGSYAFTDIGYEVAPEQPNPTSVKLRVSGVVDQDTLDQLPEEPASA